MSTFYPPAALPDALRNAFVATAEVLESALAFRLWYGEPGSDAITGARAAARQFDIKEFQRDTQELREAIERAEDRVYPWELVFNTVMPGRPHGNAHKAALAAAWKIYQAAGRSLLSLAGIETCGPADVSAVRRFIDTLPPINDVELLDAMRGEVSVAALRQGAGSGGDAFAPAKHVAILNDTDKNILEALGKDTMKGELLAGKAGYPYNSNFKSTLSSLKKRHLLDNHGRGYFNPQHTPAV
jgi:hypothetical protein